jgi:hypothetical protein
MVSVLALLPENDRDYLPDEERIFRLESIREKQSPKNTKLSEDIILN